MKIRDIMSAKGLVTVRPADDVGLAAQILLWAGVRHLPVVRGTEVVGVLSERDILHQGAPTGAAHAPCPVEQAMSTPPVTIGPDDSVVTAATLILSRKIGCLPVVGPEGLMGIVTRTDLLRHDLQATFDRAAASRPPDLGKVMKPAPVVAAADTELFEAAAMMSRHCVRHLPVVDGERRVIGMLSDRDLRAAIGDPRQVLEDPEARRRVAARRVGDVMSRTVISLQDSTPLSRAIDHLVHEPIGALPVVDEAQHLVGIVSYVDVIQNLRLAV
jgi:CBS domain-containing protein